MLWTKYLIMFFRKIHYEGCKLSFQKYIKKTNFFDAISDLRDSLCSQKYHKTKAVGK